MEVGISSLTIARGVWLQGQGPASLLLRERTALAGSNAAVSPSYLANHRLDPCQPALLTLMLTCLSTPASCELTDASRWA